MNRKQLTFVMAYADVYAINSVEEAIEASNVRNEKEDYIDIFLDYYDSMIEFGMKFEVQTSMEVCGLDFIPACNEWDL